MTGCVVATCVCSHLDTSLQIKQTERLASLEPQSVITDSAPTLSSVSLFHVRNANAVPSNLPCSVGCREGSGQREEHRMGNPPRPQLAVQVHPRLPGSQRPCCLSVQIPEVCMQRSILETVLFRSILIYRAHSRALAGPRDGGLGNCRRWLRTWLLSGIVTDQDILFNIIVRNFCQNHLGTSVLHSHDFQAIDVAKK